VRGLRRCRERNGELLLAGVGGSAQTIFTLTGLNRALRVFRDADTACAAVGAA
jgi:anti-anti-sigma regulatory factor